MPNPEKTTPPPQKRVLPAADDVEALTGDFDKLDVETGQAGSSLVATQDIDVGDGESTRRRPGPRRRPSASGRRCGGPTRSTSLRWYRSPELVFLQPYGFAVDVWACACVIAECFLGTCKEVVEHREGRRPLFPGRSCFPLSPAAGGRGGWHQKNDQLQAIFRVRGTPTPAEIDSLEHDYKGMKAYLRRLQPRQASDLHRVLRGVPSDCVDLLDKMLTFLPEDRLSLDEAYNTRTSRGSRKENWNGTAHRASSSPRRRPWARPCRASRMMMRGSASRSTGRTGYVERALAPRGALPFRIGAAGRAFRS